ncbi:EAL domain-containing protein [Parasulfuritortus cantonensis]|uniref:EAL domain-containing protein n=1 Tax=Parasulfuritortus cantonensis TaxID=2528202 RepID=A0A4R1B6X0_9PROT|nr:EAL domain-containing protein [Parasulfuritortus cantonensis]TCJ11805.1 EAL domain-containing protein [Parasulfuritortus cantonensis]
MAAPASPSLLAGLLELSRDGILIADAGFRLLELNAVAADLAGLDPAGARGLAIEAFGAAAALPVPAVRQALAETGRWQGSSAGGQAVRALRIDEGAERRYLFVLSAAPAAPVEVDPLTELPTRAPLIERLDRAVARARADNRLVAVICLDIDRFKAVNDQYGHPTGDHLLRKVAGRLRGILRADDTLARVAEPGAPARPGDTVARVGGDEFVILANALPNMDAVEDILARILALTAQPCEVDGRLLGVSTSLGVTVYPLDAADTETLLRHADQAMYEAKQDGRGRYNLFDAARDQRVQSRRHVVGRLRQALRDDELELHFQPKVNLRQGRMVGLEALLRWRHPERGLVMPGEFLPQVEHDDLIVEIGTWVIRRALAQMAAWRAAGLDLAVSVNVAARQLLADGFLAALHACLAEFPDLARDRLELEILESSALENTARVRQVMEACGGLGIGFALDDFGTGYASLTYLKEIPAEVLKIDQSFVRHILDDGDDLALVEGVIGLASAFRRQVVAEGVESAEQGVLLMRLGCDVVQGYGIARPMPAERVPGWLAEFRPDPQWARWADARWEMVDFPLLVAQYDHLKWVRELAGHLDGGELGLRADELSDHHRCRFGHWYYGQGMARYGDLPEFRALEGVHREVHRLGPEIAGLQAGGRNAEARRRLGELFRLKDRILEQLALLQAVVARRLPG